MHVLSSRSPLAKQILRKKYRAEFKVNFSFFLLRGNIVTHTRTHREIYLYTCSDFRLPTANVCKYDVVLPGSSQVQQLSGTARVLAPGVYLFSKRAENILIQKDPGEIRLRWLELKGILGCSGEKNYQHLVYQRF